MADDAAGLAELAVEPQSPDAAWQTLRDELESASEGEMATDCDDSFIRVDVPAAYAVPRAVGGGDAMAPPEPATEPATSDAELLTPWTFSAQRKWLLEICDRRVKMVNGRTPLGGDPFFGAAACLHCDYCDTAVFPWCGPMGRHMIPPRNRTNLLDYWHCPHCSKDMCWACGQERDAETAAADGALNNAKREDKACFGHGLELRTVCEGWDCDICGEALHGQHQMYSRDADIDICLDCETTDEGKELIAEHQLTRRAPPMPWQQHQPQFGSLLDWVPVFGAEGAGCALITVNCNPASAFFRRAGFVAIDADECCGFWKCRDPLPVLLERVRQTRRAQDAKTATEKRYDSADAIAYTMETDYYMQIDYS
jgi:hypothetical protein